MESGIELDALIRTIVAGHHGIAILLVAVALALQSTLVSEAVLPLLTSQRLLAADSERFGYDLGGATTPLIGFDGRRDGAHIAAVRAAHARPARRHTLSSLIPIGLVIGGSLAERMRPAFDALPGDLAFETEEQRISPEFREAAEKAAARYRELADPANTRLYPADVPGSVVVVHESPSATEPGSLLARENARRSLEISGTWIWASKCINEGQQAVEAELVSAIVLARELDDPSLFEGGFEDADMGQRQGTVAAVAAVCLGFQGCQDADLRWARDVVSRAARDGAVLGPFFNPMTHHPWHHAMFAAHGLAAEAGRLPATPGPGPQLLRLVGHPLDEVSLAAVRAAFSVWDVDPRLGWCALLVKLTMLESDMGRPRREDALRHAPEAVSVIVARGIQAYERETGWPALPTPPPPWIREEPSTEGATWNPWRRSRRQQPDAASQGWHPNPIQWDWRLCGTLLGLLPSRRMLEGPSRAEFLSLVTGMLAWSLQTLHPPWANHSTGYREGTKPFEFTTAFGRLLGNVCGYISLAEAKRRFLDPIFALPDEPCWELLAPLLDRFVRVHVMDAEEVSPEAPELVMACAGRVLVDATFSPGRHRSGDLFGFQLPKLVDSLFFVNAEQAPGAARFANGVWSDIGPFIPSVDLVVRAAGWSPAVLGRFLTLCERARETFPAPLFADLVLAILDGPGDAGRRWQGLTLTARLAGVVQHMATRESPMNPDLARKLLRILDHLVDMGDRRAAALQTSEAFRQVVVDYVGCGQARA